MISVNTKFPSFGWRSTTHHVYYRSIFPLCQRFGKHLCVYSMVQPNYTYLEVKIVDQ